MTSARPGSSDRWRHCGSGSAGTIAITLRRQGARNILLKIADNGVGLPPDFDLAANNSLGMQLIRLFAEQLEGELFFQGRDGVEISLLFRQEFAASVVVTEPF